MRGQVTDVCNCVKRLFYGRFNTIRIFRNTTKIVISPFLINFFKRIKSYPCNRPWRPMGLSHVEAPIFSRQSAHRRRWGCQPYAPATPCPQEDSWYSFLLEAKPTIGLSAAGRIRSIEKSNDLIGNWTRDLPACSIVPQPTTLPLAPSALVWCLF
jgi:hypothetical protein